MVEKVSPTDPTAECSTAVELLRWRAFHQPDRGVYTFLRDTREEDHLTYRELELRARAIGARLLEVTNPGERALLLYPQGLDFIAAFFGCLCAGVIAIPAYPPRPNQSMARIDGILTDARPSVVLTTSDLLSKVEAAWAQDLCPAVPCLATDDVPEKVGRSWQELAEEWCDPGSAINKNTIAYLQYTSGSTSTAKGVIVSYDNLFQNLLDLDRGWNHTTDSVLVSWLPHFHDMGLVYGILEALYKGFPCYLMAPLSFIQRPVRWLQAISKYKATHSVAPNFAYELCIRKIKPEQRSTLDLGSWAVAVNGAEPVRKETLERFAETFEPCGFRWDAFCPGYGLAEATLKVTATRRVDAPVLFTVDAAALEQNRVVEATPDRKDARTLVGCGRSMVDTKIVIVHPETFTPCGPDEVGEIWISGSIVSRGYWNRPEETDYTFRARLSQGEGPFLRTGDLGFLRDGHLYVTGRLKDLIIIRGQNHYPQDIEKTAEQTHPGLRQPGYCAAFSVDIHNEERLVIVQEVERQTRNLDLDDIVGAIRQAISENHELQAYDVVLVKAGIIPKTSSGKIQRQACRAAYLAGTLDMWGR